MKYTKTSVKHQYAANYVTDGFKVLPCWPNSKKPLTPNGHNGASMDPDMIDYWWSRCPDANIAILTQDLLVLDVDVKNGVNGYNNLRKLEKKYCKLPKTMTQSTPSGGMHYFFKTSNIIVPSLINCPSTGLDIRAYSGYIMAEPSTIDGASYVMSHWDIVDAPVWLMVEIYSYIGGQENDCYHPEIINPAYHPDKRKLATTTSCQV